MSFHFFSKKSLTRKTLINMAISIGIAIILIALISYLYLTVLLKSQTVEQLEHYITERGQRESSIFLLAQDNHLILKKEFEQRLEQLGKSDPQVEFQQLFAKFPDGTTRNRLKDNQSIKDFESTKYPTVFLGPQVKINADIRRRVVTFYELLTSYGPAWRSRFVDTYINAPENIVSIYWPGETWGLSATADLDIRNEEYFYVSDKTHNPERKQAWTGLYFDHVVKLWMVSLETPVDDAQGKHIATIGNDIILNELMDRTINDTLDGAYNLILRADGRLIAHPEKMAEIKDKAGYFDISKSKDPHLKRIFQDIKNLQTNQVIVDNAPDHELLAVTKIEGPDWYFVTVYPKSLLSKQAVKTAFLIFMLGMILLLLEIILLFFFLRRQIAQPLQEFLSATQQISAGNFSLATKNEDGRVIALPVERDDELGELANSFKGMVEQMKSSFDILEVKNTQLVEVMKRNTKQDWLKTGQTQLSEKLSGEKNILQLSKNIINFITPYLEAQIGAIYLFEENEDNTKDGIFKLKASYGYIMRKSVANQFKLAEGLVGQTALEQQTIVITESFDDYNYVQSALKEGTLSAILAMPFMYENKIKGVLELASIKEFTKDKLEFLELIAPMIAIAVNTAESQQKMEILLKQSQQQANKLQS